MQVCFRVDAGISIGGGHLSRCLTLANALVRAGVSRCIFILKSHKGNFSQIISDSGHHVELLKLDQTPDYSSNDYEQWVGGSFETDAQSCLVILQQQGFTKQDWMIVDHYGLDDRFESLIAAKGFRIAVIDDLANRDHNCQLLIDQTCGRTNDEYERLVSKNTYLMTGQRFCILRPEFSRFREASKKKRCEFTKIKTVFINFGSTDPTNVTTKIIDDLNYLHDQIKVSITVAIGSNSPHLTSVKASIKRFNGTAEIFEDAQNMAELMLNADIAIGAAGSTTWERCALGLPTILVKTAENQNVVISRVIKLGAAKLHTFETNDRFKELLENFNFMQINYKSISDKCFDLIDAEGTKIIVRRLLKGDWK